LEAANDENAQPTKTYHRKVIFVRIGVTDRMTENEYQKLKAKQQ